MNRKFAGFLLCNWAGPLRIRSGHICPSPLSMMAERFGARDITHRESWRRSSTADGRVSWARQNLSALCAGGRYLLWDGQRKGRLMTGLGSQARYAECVSGTRSGFVKRLCVLCWVAGMIGAASNLCAQQPSIHQRIEEALLARSDAWPTGAAAGVASDVVGLQEQLGVTFTDRQITDIAAGLRDPTWEQEITDCMHPLTRQRNHLRIVHRVREYLKRGPAADNARAAALASLQATIGQWSDECVTRFPDKEALIEKAANEALAQIRRKCGNPLRIDYATPVGPATVKQAQDLWRMLLDRLEFTDSPSDGREAIEVLVLFLQASNLLEYANREAKPLPADLIAAEDALRAGLSEVSAFERAASDLKTKRERQSRERMALLRAMRATPSDVQAHLDGSVEGMDAHADQALTGLSAASRSPGTSGGEAEGAAAAPDILPPSSHRFIWTGIGSAAVLITLLILFLRIRRAVFRMKGGERKVSR